jgi:MFS superfamily sulfate permease-like transporter
MTKRIEWLPGIAMLRRYDVTWLPHDVVAGLVLATMLVPVGIAYATASGLPGIYGLYATIVPLLAYAFFGPSRILVLGPDSALAAVILGVVLPLSGGDPVRAVTLAHDGHRFGGSMHTRRHRAPGFRDRAALQAHTLRLHKRNCIDGID